MLATTTDAQFVWAVDTDTFYEVISPVRTIGPTPTHHYKLKCAYCNGYLDLWVNNDWRLASYTDAVAGRLRGATIHVKTTHQGD